jgi:hypothetical protein
MWSIMIVSLFATTFSTAGTFSHISQKTPSRVFLWQRENAALNG